ncbi:tRNA (N(6)-L-threonylcarbamoyladenosine(37)-C(2))-methylthiotransferase MtaB [Anaerobranca gottschalkii]|uniref:Threonylcarbamoyladenosine tRNA methylthiotransferase MtaB n=1 Tax=Anaerobranca gottschalkii DSM 13577 TaxID=1120990 RepID=A0A1H9YDY1_9FIRM|nr:tRNA (N(6)-L-threonylcarbamoyladenosine(37)-C(2))-methylthiotransferase MtaB [Anaerobranca gottschalkii]SES66670.1 threonylcarbamoyladenosine tRNA methylthiotransferase MtaB [Anaerobranca gottschalkii DSM 13577]
MNRVAFMTLGCKVNQDETDSMIDLFKKRGYQIVDFNEKSDIYVINTCTVTQVGSKKSRQMIRRAHRLNPDALIVVTGCYSQTASEEVAKIPGVSLIVGNDQKHNIVKLSEEALGKNKAEKPEVLVSQRHELTKFHSLPIATNRQRHRATLKIQEGCDNFCTYCIVPYARGPIRSKPLKDVVEDCKQLVKEGYQEIVLTGIHLGAYGRDLSETLSLADVVNSLSEITDLKRLRLSSIEPTDFSMELLTAIKNSNNICNHFHVPLQNGCDKILDLMGRKYDSAYYEKVIETLRSIKKDVAITTDIMVGFPGETDEDFNKTLEFVEKIRFSGIHVFKYSPREGTPASTFPNQVPNSIKEKRSDILTKKALELKHKYYQQFLGEEVEVLFEKEVDGKIEGHTTNYMVVQANGTKELLGSILPVELLEIEGETIFGRIKGEFNGR